MPYHQPALPNEFNALLCFYTVKKQSQQQIKSKSKLTKEVKQGLKRYFDDEKIQIIINSVRVTLALSKAANSLKLLLKITKHVSEIFEILQEQNNP